MTPVRLLQKINAPEGIVEIFSNTKVNVTRYEEIDKVDGKSFGIYLYKHNEEGEKKLVAGILDYLVVPERLKNFVLMNYDATPRGEEFCIHFPVGSNALIRTHTKPTESDYAHYGNNELGDLGIKGFTLTKEGDIKDVKYYYKKGSIITTVKYASDGQFLEEVITDCEPIKIVMRRRDGQVYQMYSQHLYNSFIEPRSKNGKERRTMALI